MEALYQLSYSPISTHCSKNSPQVLGRAMLSLLRAHPGHVLCEYVCVKSRKSYPFCVPALHILSPIYFKNTSVIILSHSGQSSFRNALRGGCEATAEAKRHGRAQVPHKVTPRNAFRKMRPYISLILVYFPKLCLNNGVQKAYAY